MAKLVVTRVVASEVDADIRAEAEIPTDEYITHSIGFQFPDRQWNMWTMSVIVRHKAMILQIAPFGRSIPVAEYPFLVFEGDDYNSRVYSVNSHRLPYVVFLDRMLLMQIGDKGDHVKFLFQIEIEPM